MKDGQNCSKGKDGLRHHTWARSEEKIEFEDIIIVSDEVPPASQPGGKQYTLWTGAHERNELVLNGKKSKTSCQI